MPRTTDELQPGVLPVYGLSAGAGIDPRWKKSAKCGMWVPWALGLGPASSISRAALYALARESQGGSINGGDSTTTTHNAQGCALQCCLVTACASLKSYIKARQQHHMLPAPEVVQRLVPNGLFLLPLLPLLFRQLLKALVGSYFFVGVYALSQLLVPLR